MVICTVPSSLSVDSSDVSKENQIALNYKDIPTVSATSTISVNAAKIRKKVTKKKVTKKKVKAVKRYKVKVRYFYKGRWRYKYVYRTYTPVAVSKPAPAPAPAPVIRDIPYWECWGPSANCQADNPELINLAYLLTTIPNPEPRPAEPTPVDAPGAEPQLSDYSDEAAYNAAHDAWVILKNAHDTWVSEEPQQPGAEPQLSDYPDEAAYNAAHDAWEAKNTAYQEYLTLKSAYDNYSSRLAVPEYQKAVNIFEYVQHLFAYQYYYNTRYGAYGALATYHAGNCCDHAHSIIALARAAGIPARYMHADCTFSSGLRTGHVWAQLYVNGQWYSADAISFSNTFGTINNWNTGTVSLKGIYSSLPF